MACQRLENGLGAHEKTYLLLISRVVNVNSAAVPEDVDLLHATVVIEMIMDDRRATARAVLIMRDRSFVQADRSALPTVFSHPERCPTEHQLTTVGTSLISLSTLGRQLIGDPPASLKVALALLHSISLQKRVAFGRDVRGRDVHGVVHSHWHIADGYGWWKCRRRRRWL